MQPQVPQAAGTADMDLTAVQSMDWFFKKEQFYLLAQFLQQRANLADKDVNPLKDQLTTNTDTTTSNSTDIPADIDDFSAVAAAALAANSSAASTTTSTATTTDSNSTSTSTTTTTNHHTTVPPSSKLLSPISAAYSSVAAAAAAAAAAGFNSPNSVHNNNNNTKLLNSVAAAITLHQNGGNLLAATTTNTPSPSPPLSTDGCSIAAAAAACGNNSVSPLSAALNGVNGCLNPKLFFNHAQQMMMEAAAAAAAAVQQQQSPLHSPLQGAQHVDDDEMDEDGCGGGATAVDASKLITSLTAEMRLVKRGGEEDADGEEEEEEEEEEQQQGEYDNADADENANARKRSKNARDYEDSPEQHKAAVDNAKTNVCGQRTDDTSLNFSSNDSNKTTSCSVNKSNFARKTRATKASSKLDRAAEIGDDCVDNDDDGDDNDADHAAEANRMEIDGGESGESGKIDATIKPNAVGSNYAELIAAKDKEIKALIEEVQRLRTLEQTQLTQIQRLEDHLEVKRQHIIRLEARLDKQQINAALAEAAATATASSAIVTPTTTAAASSTLPVTHVVNDDDDDDDDDEGDEQDDEDGEQAAIVAIADTAAVAKIDLTTTTRAETTATERITDAAADADVDAETVADAELAVDRACEKLTTAMATTATTATATTATNNNGSNTTAAAIEVTEPTVGEIKIKKENHPLDLDVISQQSAIAAAAAAAAAAACANDPNKFQELLLEGTKALAAAEAFKSAAAGSSATEGTTVAASQPMDDADAGDVTAAASSSNNSSGGNESKEVDDDDRASPATAIAQLNIMPKIPKIEIVDDDDDDDDEDIEATEHSTMPECANNELPEGENPEEACESAAGDADESALPPTIDVDALEAATSVGPTAAPALNAPSEKSDLQALQQHVADSTAAAAAAAASCFDENVDTFGTLLGEELVNSYWRGFKMPTAASQSNSSGSASKAPNASNMFANQLQHRLPQQQPHHHHHQQPHHHPMHHHQHTTLMPHHLHHHQHHHHQQQQQQQQQQSASVTQQHGPSSTALLSQLVNSTFSSAPPTSSSSLRTDALLPSHQHHLSHHAQGPAAPPPPPPPMPSHHHLHQPHLSSDAHPKSSLDASNTSSNSNHELSANANASHALDQRDDHHSGLNGSGKSLLEDNNNTLCGTPNANAPSAAAMAAAAMAAQPHPHLPPGYLHALPFQFQDRGHFRFADDLQLPPGASMAGRLGESLIPKSDPMEAKLQEMLRYNMDKYANQPLDTLHISRRIRELLSVHNIGQRLFAKYILGLSQGTVSELLSKPKPWDKLTEKGRDSYRKMHAWGCDDNAVMLLKSLIPKKDSGLPPYGGREDSMSDDRLAHIFNEASSLIKNSTPGSLQQQLKEAEQRQLQQEQHRRSAHDDSQHSNEDSKSPHPLCTSPFYKSTSQLKQEQEAAAAAAAQQQQHRLRQEQELTPDKMARIYQEFLMRTPREAAFPSLLLSPFFSAAGGMPSGCGLPNMMGADENLRLAYEREMAKLQQQQQQNAAAAAAAGSLPNFPNFSNLMALQQQVLNGAQDLTLTKDPKDAIKINGQRSIEHSSNSMDSQSNSNSNAASMSGGGSSSQNNAKDLPHADSLERHSSAGLSLHSRKLDSSGSHTPVPPPTSSASVSMHGASNSTAPSPLSNSILPPAMTPNDDFAATASPLQRMASITNSLITQPPVPPHHTPPQRPTKAVLPPITQQQFDMFNNLNTEDIVRRVKEALSQYSISQRLFGESVLGLSQGSVSDLLARPKPWHMLTQKGREPFIRMKMFLEDENAVHKLVASQYKIAPEKLMRTGSYSGTPQIPQGLASKMGASLPMQKMMNELKLQEPTQAQHIMQQMQAAAMSAAMQQHQQQAQSQQQHAAAVQAAQAAAAAQAAHHQSMLLTSPGLPPQHAISLPPTGPTGGNTGPGTPGSDKKPMMMPIHSPHQANAMRSMHQHMSPTVYEMAALTQDLDTQVITTKIKEALLANNIGQKIFGEAVLGLSQGSVSELLSKPKPWHMLSIKGREPFIRMQLWLSDANNVERLQVIKNERREASKRRRSTGPNQQDNSSDTSSNDTNDFYTSSPGPGSVGSSVSGAPPNKKQRVLFSEEQKEALRLAFQLDPYPNVGTIEFLANELSLATRTITNWFHNHRMRLKQQVPHNQPGVDNLIPSRENTNSTPFDPVQFRILLQQRLLELHKERMGLSGAPTLPYPPYFAAAALLGRSLAGMPGAAAAAAAAAAAGAGGEPDLHALNQAFREQMSGLDLTMSSLKRERSVDYDDDLDESHLSDNESLDGGDGGGDDKSISGDYKDGTSTPRSIQLSAAASYLMGGLSASMRSSSRRKPAAPQWVNPAGPVPNTDANGMAAAAAAVAAAAAGMAPSAAEQDRIINGVCVMQPSDFSRSEAGDSPAGIDADAISKRGETDVEQPPSFMEPEVRIKQEKEDCDSDNEVSATAALATAVTTAAAAASSEEKLKVMSEDKLRMVRVQRHSHEDDAAAAAAAATASGVPTTNASVVTAASAASAWSY
ncbi:PREDICTED: homeobox protein cut isoform X2 [Rhagoletis zephyria]|uniref:homeobox protein cut isoform X2 n=1 Tax=Rhagoletis zephyria TaxID=28612 RepID=UPI0008112455|nr:PREDICTED: homeobox protein cut isoform X2 [Rhagoletis zephyria]